MTPIARFWRKTKKAQGGCIEWTAGRAKNGYGLFSVKNPKGSKRRHRTVYAHRFIYECVVGPLPPKNRGELMHSCDNRKCVALQHLSVGTRRSNMIDASAKGRTCRGERRENAKLTEGLVLEARRRHAAGESQAAIAADMGVHQVTLGKAILGKTWAHVK